MLVREVLVAGGDRGLAAMAGARRIDVTWFGKAGTFGLMVAFPLFLASAQHPRLGDTADVLAWVAGIPGLVFGYIALAMYVPLGLKALREGRAAGRVRPPTRRRAGTTACRFDPVKAVIMAGGEGTRLRPLTSNAPKPMLPLANRPMMEHIVELLKRHGFDEIVVTVAYLANHIRTYFGDGSEFGVRMVYATEEQPLGTAGSVRNAMDELDERFLVISGDVLTDIDLRRVVDFHDEHKALATIGLAAVENPLEFGIVITNDDGSIDRFLEKPTWGQVFSDTINTGIFVLEPEIFDHIEADRPVDFSGEVFPKPAGRGPPAVRRGDRGLLGGRRHARGLRVGPQGRARRQGPGRDARLRAERRRVAGGGRRGPPRRPDRRLCRVRRRAAGSTPAPGSATTPCWAATSGSAARPTSSGPSSTRTPTWPRACACAARWSAGPATCAATPAATTARCSATSASWARTRSSAPA